MQALAKLLSRPALALRAPATAQAARHSSSTVGPAGSAADVEAAVQRLLQYSMQQVKQAGQEARPEALAARIRVLLETGFSETRIRNTIQSRPDKFCA